MDISVVVPLFNEEESLPELTDWINRVMVTHRFSYETILVDDGSNDKSWEIIEDLAEKNSNIRAIKFKRNYGKSAALHSGFQIAKGDVVITMDADLQDSPDEIPELYRMIREDKFDMVSGWKKKRFDPITKTVPSKFFNYTARKVSGIKLHDFNCGLKAYDRNVIKNIEVFGEMHRYIPILAKQAGYGKIGEMVVQHQERKFGITKFGLNRFINGFLDLLTISFISKFGKRPMHFFGTLGTLILILGVLAAIYIGIEKWYFLSKGIPARLITENPFFYISMTMIIIGAQLFLSGYIAELISRTASERNTYQIEKKI